MAARDRTCIRCGEQFHHPSANGRPPDYCPDCRLERATAPRSTFARSCSSCGEAFIAKVYWARWCSPRCSKQGRKVERPDKVLADYLRKEARRKETRAAIPEHGLKAARRALINALKRRCADLRQIEKSSRPCGVCGAPIGLGKRHKYCSSDCRNRSMVTKAVRRRWAYAHRMGKKAGHAEPFDPIEILDRDGWRCQICGVSMPRSLRGTTHPRAPEVDHVVPLSRNGMHARANVQCACLRCNRVKGARSIDEIEPGVAA